MILTKVTEGSLSAASDLVGQGATMDVSACPHAEIDRAKGFRCVDTPKHRFWTQMDADFQDFICDYLRKSASKLS